MSDIDQIRERWGNVPEEDRDFRLERHGKRIHLRNRVGYFGDILVEPSYVGACASNEVLAEFLLHTHTDIAFLLGEIHAKESRIEALEDLLSGVKEDLPTRWAPCKDCDGQGYTTRIVGEFPNPGLGPTCCPEEVDSPCGECRGGYVEIEWAEDGFEDALPIHPDDE